MRGNKLHVISICALIIILAPNFIVAQEPIKLGFLYCFSERVGHYGEIAKR